MRAEGLSLSFSERLQSNLLRLLSLVCIGVALFLLGTNAWHRYRAASAAATLNGEAISRDDYFNALQLASGPQVLEKLVQQRAILQEAQRLHVTLTDEEMKTDLEAISHRTSDPGFRRVLEDQARARLLLPKVVLQGIGEEERRRFYEAFKDDLVQYDLAVIAPTVPEDARAIVGDLKTGRSFEEIVDTYPSRLKTMAHGRWGTKSPQDVARLLGPSALQQIARLKPGTVTPKPLTVDGQAVFIKVLAVRQDYDEVKPEIEAIMENAGEAELMDRLTAAAHIVSPMLISSASPSPVPSGSVSPAP
ncbi:MAG TPA: hypothetical protein VGO93_08865 [Candidatus Xenobia bacterium]